MPKVFKGSVERVSQIEQDVNIFLLNQLQQEVDNLAITVPTILNPDGPNLIAFVRKMQSVLRGLSLITDPAVLDTFGAQLTAISTTATVFFNAVAGPVINQGLIIEKALFTALTVLNVAQYTKYYSDMLTFKDLANIQFINQSPALVILWSQAFAVLEQKKNELIID